MSKTIQHKRSSVEGNQPNQDQIAVGELGINFANRSIFTKDGSDVVTELARDVWRTDTAPDSALDGDMWYNTSTGEINIWDDSDWKNIGTETGQPVDPGNITAEPEFIEGSGTENDPYVFDTVYANVGDTDLHVATLRITGLNAGQIVEMQDFNSADNGSRYKASNNIADPIGVLNLRVSFDDAPVTVNTTNYSAELKIGGNSIYINGDVVIAQKLDGGTEVPEGVPGGVGGSGPFIWQGGDTTLTATYPLQISNDGVYFTDKITVSNGDQFWLQWAGEPGSGDGIDGPHGSTISGALTDDLGGAQFFYFTIDKETSFVLRNFVDSDQPISGITESRVVDIDRTNSYIYPFGSTTGDSAQYSKNGGDWTDIPATNSGSATDYFVAGDKMQFRHRNAGTINTASTLNINFASDSANLTTVTVDVEPVILQPKIASPATDGELNISTSGPFVSSDFEMAQGVDTHTASSWEITSSGWSLQPSLASVTSGNIDMHSVAWDGNQFCAVGALGKCATSPDGVTWTLQPSLASVTSNATMKSVVWDGTQFCAVGNSGTCATSPNGVTWTNQPSLNGIVSYQIMNSVTWDGNQFCAVGNAGKCATSPNGVTWTLQPSMNVDVGGTNMYSVVWDGNQFVAVGQGSKCGTSPDGVTWTNRSSLLSAVGSTTMYSVTWNGSQYVAVGHDGKCATSPNGVTWTNQPSLGAAVGSTTMYAVVWDGNQFCAVGALGKCATSPDGVTWTNQPSFTTAVGSTNMWSVTWDGSQFCAVGHDGKCATFEETIEASLDSDTSALTSWEPTGLDYETDYTVRVKHHTATLNSEWSEDRSFRTAVQPGVQWHQQSGLNSAVGSSNVLGLTWSPELSLFCAVGGSGKCATSPDGVNWTLQSNLDYTLNAVTWSPELSLFCAVGGYRYIVTSPDGVTWTKRQGGSGATFTSIAWAPEISLFFATNEEGKGFSSPDGVSWLERSSLAGASAGVSMNSIAWSGTKFCAVGYKGKQGTSLDGVQWFNHSGGPSAPGNLEAISSGRDAKAIAWSPELSLFCAVGASGSCATSPDGIDWTSRTTEFQAKMGSNEVKAIVWDGSQFCAVGYRGLCGTSPDGVTWTNQPNLKTIFSVNSSSEHVYSIASSGGMLCAAGYKGQCATSP